MKLRLTSRSVRVMGSVAVLALFAPLVSCASQGSWSEVSEDCLAEHDLKTVKPGKLTVAMPDLSTRSSLNRNSLVGLEEDIVRLIAKRNCLSLETVRVGESGAQIPAVENGDVDLALGFWHRNGDEGPGVRFTEPIVVKEKNADDEGGGSGGVAHLRWTLEPGNESLSVGIDEELMALRDNGMLARLLEKWGLDPESSGRVAPLG
ncbi:transporter substrate-binding domain-containing protein [Leucobacter sp. GX24907]